MLVPADSMEWALYRRTFSLSTELERGVNHSAYFIRGRRSRYRRARALRRALPQEARLGLLSSVVKVQRNGDASARRLSLRSKYAPLQSLAKFDALP